MSRISFTSLFLILVILILQSCQIDERSRGEILYDQQCVRCHIAPNIQDLPENIWKNNILPDMGARMGIATEGYDPYEGFSYEEKIATMKTNIFPSRAVISETEWQELREYVLSKAPDSMDNSREIDKIDRSLNLFDTKQVKLDQNPGSLITYLEYLPNERKLALGDIQNQLRMYDFETNQVTRTIQGSSPIISYNNINDNEYVTQIGRLNPSEIPSGSFTYMENGILKSFNKKLHRPVYNSANDLDLDGTPEFIVSEFGNFTGKVSLLKIEGDSLASKTLLPQPGTIRTVVRDMNNDGKKDIIALTSQGDESITIMYQDAPLEFHPKKVIRFSPVYGTSWFQLMDYNNDGNIDIATVHGDNADKSQVLKPYHGLRIHLNDGENNFKETFFYPINGATRLLARDFDEDGDIDFAIIATFPDYSEDLMRSFVYLENKDPSEYEFTNSTFEDVAKARWFLMDAADIDNDGDLDIILSAFSYAFNPVPKEIQENWKENDIDMILLENKLQNPSK